MTLRTLVARPRLDLVLRVLVAAWLVVISVSTITTYRSDLLDQTAIGTDSSNYYAAGLRLNAGHQLYHLSSGDRPVPLLPPPQSDAALLSPPLLAILWRPLALLGDVSMVLWWLAGAAILGGMALWMAIHGSRRRLAVLAVIAPAVGLAMWSGNVNPFIVTLLVGVWAASVRGRPGLAGTLLAVAAGLKLTPVWLIAWFVFRRDWTAIRAAVAVGIVLAVVSLLGAGLDNHFEYLRVAATTGTLGATPGSLVGILRDAGVPPSVASVASIAWVGFGVLSMWLLRHRPGAAFAVGVATVLYSSPVVLLGNLAVLLAATAPFPASSAAGEPRPVSGQPADAPAGRGA